jgi:hypothetical protein
MKKPGGGLLRARAAAILRSDDEAAGIALRQLNEALNGAGENWRSTGEIECIIARMECRRC